MDNPWDELVGDGRWREEMKTFGLSLNIDEETHISLEHNSPLDCNQLDEDSEGMKLDARLVVEWTSRDQDEEEEDKVCAVALVPHCRSLAQTRTGTLCAFLYNLPLSHYFDA